MEATIASFRGSRRKRSHNHMIIKIEGIETREKAQGLVGKKVTWTSPGKKELKGTIRSAHGNKGAVRAIFETGMPGQCLGTETKIE